MRSYFFTTLALIAFAANSILNRMALSEAAIGPAGFVLLRVVFAVVLLLPLFWLQARRMPQRPQHWWGPFGLLAYLVGFSFAYTGLDAGFGALVLFGTVQLSMFIAVAMFEHTPRGLEIIGALIAFGGLSMLLLDGVLSISTLAVVAMVLAGLGWAAFTMAGRGAAQPLELTTVSFLALLPIVVVGYLPFIGEALTPYGVWLAFLSGAITSGLGYFLWYAALRDLSGITAAVLQLTVPVIAIALGVVFLEEAVSLRLLAAATVVICGILLTLYAQRRR